MSTPDRLEHALVFLTLAALTWAALELVQWLIDGWARRRVASIEAEEDGPDVNSCEALELFLDGELLPGAAEIFRGHLADCAGCQASFTEHMHLTALAHQHFHGGRNAN